MWVSRSALEHFNLDVKRGRRLLILLERCLVNHLDGEFLPRGNVLTKHHFAEASLS